MTAAVLKSTARAIADLDAGTILATVEIAAPPERVFRALSTDEITRWWGSDDTYRSTAYTADLRVGGRWRSDGTSADGRPFFVEGEFLEIDPPRKLVQTWRPAWDPAVKATTVTYRLEPIEGGTRLTLRHDGFGDQRQSCADHGRGWERVLGWLTAHVVGPRADRVFLLRLIPPRPTFRLDMTADERAVMGQHVAYWRGHLDAGTAIVYGPVDDPKGGWGLGVVRAPDEPAVREIEAKDPAVRGLGMHYEVLPMARAVYRE